MWCCCWIRRMTSTTCALAPVGSFCFVFLLSATFNAEVSYPKLVRICLTSFVVQFKVSQPMEVCVEKGHTITHEFLLWWCCLTCKLLMVDDGIVVNHPFIPFWTVLQQARSKFGACLFRSNLFFYRFKSSPVLLFVFFQVTEFFSYEHFYVLYCKFWELDNDHDFYISKEVPLRQSCFYCSWGFLLFLRDLCKSRFVQLLVLMQYYTWL